MPVLTALLCAFLLPTLAAAQSASGAMKASALIGMEVRNPGTGATGRMTLVRASTLPDGSAAAGASRAPGSDALFRKLDRNGDGVLSDAELDRRASERRNWIALDLDRDGRITREEFTGVRGE
jgi:hypothetical protein